jgi:hypothetical protein
MTRILIAAAAAALLTNGSAALAADKPIPQPVQTALEAQAQKDCDAALDAGRFDYSSMDECVADKIAKLERGYRAQAAAPAAASGENASK